MRILITGGGEVASQTAARLIREGNELIIVEEDPTRCARLEETLDAKIVQGSAASVVTLHEAGIRDAEMLIAVTNVDEVNLLTCLVAQAESGPKVKVARVRTHEVDHWRRICKQVGVRIDLIIHPESLAVERMLPVLPIPGVSDIIEFAAGRVKLFGMNIEPDHWTVGKTLIEIADCGAPPNSLVAMIFRGSEVIIPRGSEKILAGDHIYVVTRSEEFDDVLRFLGIRRQERLERVFILGGKQIGIAVAQALEKQGVSVKLFERDAGRCRKIAEILKETIVVNADGTDANVLQAENIRGISAYLALTHDDEENLIAAVLARRLEARKVVALINRLSYLAMAQRLGINTTISPRLATVDRILQFVRKGHVVSVTSFREEEAEAIELVASPSSPFVGKKLKDIKFPPGAIVGAVARTRGDVIIPRGHSTIEPGDRVILFALEHVVPKIESAFLVEKRKKLPW